MTEGLFASLTDWLTEDTVLDSFYLPAFKTESEYLKNKRKEIIEADKARVEKGEKSPILLTNKTTKKFNLTKPEVLV